MMKTTSTALVIAILSTGCLTEPTDLDDLDAPATASDGATLRDTRYATADLGPAAGRACFLSGVAGYLTTAGQPETGSQTGAGAVLDLMTNHWQLYVDPASAGATLQASARCAPAAHLTAEVTWRTGDHPQLLAPVTATRRCFFTELTTGRDGEYPRGAFQSEHDGVWIDNDGTDWYIDGSASGLLWAAARCIDVTGDDARSLEGALTRVAGRLDASL
jgi:hypothetical protein